MINVHKSVYRFFWSLFWRCLLLSARRRTVHGTKVGVLLPPVSTVSAEELFSKVAAALDLLRDHGPRQLARMRRLVSGVLVFGSVGPDGEWHPEARLILLREPNLAKSDTHPAQVACLLVHEISHAWLEHRGCEYVSGRRRRIEAICCRAEARLAHRIPGGNELGGYYEFRAQQILSQSDDDWSDAAFRKRAVGNLHILGAPTWLMRFIELFRPGI
jgi:hypothetical protein